MAGPARGRSRRVTLFRALLPCLALIAFDGTPARAQTVTPDLFSPTRSSQIATPDSPLRRTGNATVDKTGNAADDARLRERDTDTPAPSRIGQIPSYGLPAASGASDWGYDSLNRKRRKAKYYPGQVKPKAPVGARSTPAPNRIEPAAGAFDSAVGIRQQGADPPRDGRHGARPAAAQAAQDR